MITINDAVSIILYLLALSIEFVLALFGTTEVRPLWAGVTASIVFSLAFAYSLSMIGRAYDIREGRA